MNKKLTQLKEEVNNDIERQETFLTEMTEEIRNDIKEVKFIATEKMEKCTDDVKETFEHRFKDMRDQNIRVQRELKENFNNL